MNNVFCLLFFGLLAFNVWHYVGAKEPDFPRETMNEMTGKELRCFAVLRAEDSYLCDQNDNHWFGMVVERKVTFPVVNRINRDFMLIEDEQKWARYLVWNESQKVVPETKDPLRAPVPREALTGRSAGEFTVFEIKQD